MNFSTIAQSLPAAAGPKSIIWHTIVYYIVNYRVPYYAIICQTILQHTSFRPGLWVLWSFRVGVRVEAGAEQPSQPPVRSSGPFPPPSAPTIPLGGGGAGHARRLPIYGAALTSPPPPPPNGLGFRFSGLGFYFFLGVSDFYNPAGTSAPRWCSLGSHLRLRQQS